MEASDARYAVYRRAQVAALALFRKLPTPTRRALTHAVSPSYSVGAVAVCQDRNGRVLLVKSRHNHGWSLPGGLLKRGEGPQAALMRELAEELGVRVRDDELDKRPRVVVDPRARQVTVVFGLTLSTPPAMDGVEVVGCSWFPPTDLPAALLRGTRESLVLLDVLDA